MAEKVRCTRCDAEAGDSLEGWTHCEECDADYCPNCSGDFREEREQIERLRNGSAWDRLTILCPRCGSELDFPY